MENRGKTLTQQTIDAINEILGSKVVWVDDKETDTIHVDLENDDDSYFVSCDDSQEAFIVLDAMLDAMRLYELVKGIK